MSSRQPTTACEEANPIAANWPTELITILEPEPLLERFARWVCDEIPFEAMRFFHTSAGLDAFFPTPF